MTYTIKVTAEDIADGEPCNQESCAIALAANRALDCKGAWVGALGNSDPFLAAKGYGYALPALAQAWMDAFDDCEPVEPITFTVEGP